MRRTIATVLLMCGTATPSLAQEEHSAFLRGFGGVTFLTEPAGVFGAGMGARVHDRVDVFGEFGQLTNIMPRSIQSDLDAAAASMEGFFGAPLTIDGKAPALYGFAGIRVTHAAGSRLNLFAEGGGGVARGVSDIQARAGTTDVSAQVKSALRIKHSETRPLLVLGSGVTLPLAERLAMDLGYRYMAVFTDEPRIDVGTMSVGLRWGF